jgi:hypothetical protein
MYVCSHICVLARQCLRVTTQCGPVDAVYVHEFVRENKVPSSSYVSFASFWLHVCLYVCMFDRILEFCITHVCMYVCMYAYMYVCARKVLRCTCDDVFFL